MFLIKSKVKGKVYYQIADDSSGKREITHLGTVAKILKDKKRLVTLELIYGKKTHSYLL